MAGVLVVYYSRSGHTARLARAIAGVAAWDLEPIVDRRPRGGLRGFLRSGWEASFRRLPAIEPPLHDVSRYDLVVIGTPVWNVSPSSPVRTWMEQHRGQLRNVAFFATCGSRGAKRAFDQMALLAGRAPLAVIDLSERELRTDNLAPRVSRFVVALEHVVAHNAPLVH